jgi:hypothetical protein
MRVTTEECIEFGGNPERAGDGTAREVPRRFRGRGHDAEAEGGRIFCMLRTYHLVCVTGGHGPPFSYPSRPSTVSELSFDSTRAVRSKVYIPPPLPPLPADHQPQAGTLLALSGPPVGDWIVFLINGFYPSRHPHLSTYRHCLAPDRLQNHAETPSYRGTASC